MIKMLVEKKKKEKNTYQSPTTNLVAINVPLENDKLDSAKNTKLIRRVVCKTFFRPHVSVTRPQKCDVNITPINPIDFIKPCSEMVKCKSHFAAGSTYVIFISSANTETIAMPLMAKTII